MRTRQFIKFGSTWREAGDATIAPDAGADVAHERRMALLTTLAYLKNEALALRAHLAATLIGAAAEALCASDVRAARATVDDVAEDLDPSEDSRAGLRRCLTLLREEMVALSDPMPGRFVHAAILSLGESGPWEIASGLQVAVAETRSRN